MPRPSSGSNFSNSLPLPAGIVTGADYRTLLTHCLKEKYCLPAVNISSTNMLNAVLEAAAHKQADIIIQISSGSAAFYGGPGLKDTAQARLLGAVSMAQHAHLVAQFYGISVILHTDHAHRAHLPWLDALIRIGEEQYHKTGKPLFSSHMLDLSTEPLEQNLEEAEKLLQRLTPLGMGLEIELGLTGGEEDGFGQELKDGDAINPHLYTTPKDIITVWQKLSSQGFLSIAASFGNVHGVYAPGNVKLRPQILHAAQISQAHCAGLGNNAANLIPFVFHGGSGTPKESIKEAIAYGVVKMNIDTDTQFAFAKGVGHYVRHHEEAFQHQVSPLTGKPLKNLYDPRCWLREGEKSCIQRLYQAFDILGATGRSLAQPVSRSSAIKKDGKQDIGRIW